jgi:ABC-type Fe3+ transport system substrate-binding protein
MIYSFTMLKTAPNPLASEAFMAFLLDKDKGLKIMEDSGQKSVVPYPSKYYQDVPSGLKKYVSKIE